MRSASEILRAGFPLICGRSMRKHPQNIRTMMTDKDEGLYGEKHAIRLKAQQKITEMKSVVTDFTEHVEEGIKRRLELQKKAEEYLKALETSGDSITEKLDAEEMKSATAKIQEMRRLVNEFSLHNQEGIKRRRMMQDMANEYLRALDDYKLRLQTLDPPKIYDTRE